jgi:hypothetical protein
VSRCQPCLLRACRCPATRRRKNRPFQKADFFAARTTILVVSSPRDLPIALSQPFAPERCRWTLTIVPSMSAYSKSASSDKAAKIRSNTPSSARRRKRFHTDDHLPKLSGESAPRNASAHNHETASINSSRPAEIALLARQKRSNPFPLGIDQQCATQGCASPHFSQPWSL